MCIIEFVVLLLVFVSGVCLLCGCFWFWLAGVCICILLFVVFGLGAILIGPGLDKDPENFVNRFLILTTVQLLAAMSILAALAYLKMSDMRVVALQFISVFVILLAVQSFFLVKGVKNQTPIS